jgi:hypothetical protein
MPMPIPHLVPMILMLAAMQACARPGSRDAGTADAPVRAAPDTVTVQGAPTLRVRTSVRRPGEPSMDGPTVALPRVGWRPTSPHADHISVANTMWGLNDRSPEWQVRVGARTLDRIMEGPLARFHAHNPTATLMVYIAPFFVYRAETPYDQWQRMERWFSDPALNPRRYRMEDAFVHSALPKSEATRRSARVWNADRWMVNPGDPGYRAFMRWLVDELLSQPHINAIFFDELSHELYHYRQLPVEYQSWDAMTAAFVGFARDLREHLGHIGPRGEGAIIGNPANLGPSDYYQAPYGQLGGQWVVDFFSCLGGTHNEGLLVHQANEEAWAKLDRYAEEGACGPAILKPTTGAMNWASWSQMPNAETFLPRGHRSVAYRGKMWELAWFYVGVHRTPRRSWLGITSSHPPPELEAELGFAPIYYRDVGRPLDTDPRSARTLIAEGTDSRGTPARVWMREFENAIVLVRNRHSWDTEDWSGEIRVALPPGRWYRLLDDDTVADTPTIEFPMAMLQGAIFMRGER